MASFSSRGPTGDWIKPDVTAPGVQVLAGTTPQPDQTTADNGPTGNLYMAIAGTSMSSPHSAGVSALVKAAHPSWTPAEIKSALMTSSVQTVVKEDGVTPADPFDMGAGSIRAEPRGQPDGRLRRDLRRLRRGRNRPAPPDRPQHPEHRRDDDDGLRSPRRARRSTSPVGARASTVSITEPAGVDDHGREEEPRPQHPEGRLVDVPDHDQRSGRGERAVPRPDHARRRRAAATTSRSRLRSSGSRAR